VAAAFGHRNIVGGTVVFTGPVNMAKNPTSLTGAQALHLRDLTGSSVRRGARNGQRCPTVEGEWLRCIRGRGV